jgi:hypothetical protein
MGGIARGEAVICSQPGQRGRLRLDREGTRAEALNLRAIMLSEEGCREAVEGQELAARRARRTS